MDIKQKYKKKIEAQFKDKLSSVDFSDTSSISSEYLQFKQDNQALHMGWYEAACKWCQKNVPIKPDEKQAKNMEADIEACHLQLKPEGVLSFAIIAPMSFIMLAGMLVFVITQNLFLLFLVFILGGVMILPLMNFPSYVAQRQRMLASNQMILGVFYVVTYMRHTSNLERAVDFASQHLQKPLSLDLKKVIWDVETGKFDDIFDSLENYLDKWKGFNDEFVESMHVIVGSLYESSEVKRQELLDKALDLILEETYDKMLHYAHNLQSPITALHMLGIVLPILGLIILPLMVNFLDDVRWYYLALFYNVFLPIVIYILSKRILSKRPSGYGGVEVDMSNPEVKRLSKPEIKLGKKVIPVNAKSISITIFILFFCLGFFPIAAHTLGFPDFGYGEIIDSDGYARSGAECANQGIRFCSLEKCYQQFCFLDYTVVAPESSTVVDGEELPVGARELGPYGIGATLLGLFIPLAFAASLGIYYQFRTNKLKKLRDETQKLEQEFTGALFQLGNRLGDGLPPELAFSKVAEVMPKSKSGDFFTLISQNIRRLGLSVDQAIFDEKIGALVYYPSSLIASSMKILTQSAKKGPAVASNAIANVARYVREMNRVNERLTDLMAEVISSMKSQISFLTPVIAGIVIGITSMITGILRQLKDKLGGEDGLVGSEAGALGGTSQILDMFGDGIPTFYFQIIVGIYVVQVVYLLTLLVNSIQNGVDPINEQYLLGKNLLKSVGLYIVISFIIIIIFNAISSVILATVAS